VCNCYVRIDFRKCACTCVRMYLYVHTHTYTHTFSHIHTHTPTCTHTWMCDGIYKLNFHASQPVERWMKTLQHLLTGRRRCRHKHMYRRGRLDGEGVVWGKWAKENNRLRKFAKDSSWERAGKAKPLRQPACLHAEMDCISSRFCPPQKQQQCTSTPHGGDKGCTPLVGAAAHN